MHTNNEKVRKITGRVYNLLSLFESVRLYDLVVTWCLGCTIWEKKELPKKPKENIDLVSDDSYKGFIWHFNIILVSKEEKNFAMKSKYKVLSLSKFS